MQVCFGKNCKIFLKINDYFLECNIQIFITCKNKKIIKNQTMFNLMNIYYKFLLNSY